MNRQVDFQTSVGGHVVGVDQMLVHAGDGQLAIGRVGEGQGRLAQIALDARLDDGTGAGVAEVVHVGEGHGAEAQHFRDGQERGGIGFLVGDLGLEGEHAVVEPLLQGQVFGVAAQQGHGRVRMGVVHARHERAPGSAVDLPEVFGGGAAAHVGDRIASRAHPLVVFCLKVLVDDLDIGKQHGRSLGRARRGAPTPVRTRVCNRL